MDMIFLWKNRIIAVYLRMRGKRTIKVLFKTVRSLTMRLRDLITASKKKIIDSITI
jgi:hypothetical protein